MSTSKFLDQLATWLCTSVHMLLNVYLVEGIKADDSISLALNSESCTTLMDTVALKMVFDDSDEEEIKEKNIQLQTEYY